MWCPSHLCGYSRLNAMITRAPSWPNSSMVASILHNHVSPKHLSLPPFCIYRWRFWVKVWCPIHTCGCLKPLWWSPGVLRLSSWLMTQKVSEPWSAWWRCGILVFASSIVIWDIHTWGRVYWYSSCSRTPQNYW